MNKQDYYSDIIGKVHSKWLLNSDHDLMATSTPDGYILKKIYSSGATNLYYTKEEVQNICEFINSIDKHRVLNGIGTKWLTRNDEGNTVIHWQEHPNKDSITSLMLYPETAQNLILFYEQTNVLATA